jgi:hypothetical protein
MIAQANTVNTNLPSFKPATNTGIQHKPSPIMVYMSSDYGLFKMINGNRELNELKIKRIIRDIDAGIDVLQYYPIQVSEKGKRLEIVDGQHRFYISKKLKRPVYYILLQNALELPDIAKVNSNTEKWKTRDFINCYMQQGNKNYEQLQEFIDRYGISATVSIKMLQDGNPGTEAGLANVHDFQRGLFKVNKWNEAVALAETCKAFNSFPFWKDRGFIIAIYRIIQAKKIDVGELRKKHEKYPDMLKKQSGFKDYLFCLKNIYNRGKQLREVIY